VEKDPTFAPDGRRVAFVQDGRIAVATLGPEGAVRTEVVTAPGTRFADPSWAPDADRDVLALSVVRGEDDRDLCVGRLVDGELTPQCVEDDRFLTGQPRWSPDGRTLLVPGRRPDDRVGIVRHRSRAAFSARAGDWGKGSFATPTDEPGRGVFEAAISPDGRRLAAVANLDTDELRLYVTSARDLRLRDAEPLPIRACKVAWRADSRELVVADLGARCADATGQLLRVDAADPTRAVPLDAAGDNPSFQPRKLPG
jgi:dipeptidyl aminopeptidase/acylaminoacyl peptidase